MTLETVEDKANRLLAEHRVFVKWSTPKQVCAVVRGDSGTHDVHLHGGRWECTCQARSTCSHLTAVMRVTVPLEVSESVGDSRSSSESRPNRGVDTSGA